MSRPSWLPETRDWIALLLVCAQIGLMFALVLRPAAIPDTPVANMVIGGFMTVGFSAIIQFYFGSSKGSATKDEAISALASGQPVAVSTVTPPPSQAAPAPAQPSIFPLGPLGAKQ